VVLSQGFALLNVDRHDSANCEFVFGRTYDLEEMVERFNLKRPMYIDARRFIFAWKTLRGKINGQRF
jgi:hypothetical protein